MNRAHTPAPVQSVKKDPQFAYTLAKGLEVLGAFQTSAGVLSNKEIADITGIARATVVRLTRTLGILGYLKYNEQTARYRLAAPVLTLGYPLISQLGIRQIARPHMQELADFAHGAVSLAIRGSTHLILIESCIDRNAPSGRPDIGAARQFNDTSLGHAYYSAATGTERQEIQAFLSKRHPADWPDIHSRLKKSQAQFEQTGFVTLASPHQGITSVSVAMPGLLTDDMLVMNCAVANFLLEGDQLEVEIAPRLLHISRLLQTATGYR